MNTRTYITLVSAVALGLSCALSVADPSPTASAPTPAAVAMDACVKAFVNAAVPKDRQLAVQTERYTASSIIARKRPYAIALTATARASGKKLASATCRTDGNGAVVALNGRPVPSLVAQTASAASLTAGDE